MTTVIYRCAAACLLHAAAGRPHRRRPAVLCRRTQPARDERAGARRSPRRQSNRAVRGCRGRRRTRRCLRRRRPIGAVQLTGRAPRGALRPRSTCRACGRGHRVPRTRRRAVLDRAARNDGNAPAAADWPKRRCTEAAANSATRAERPIGPEIKALAQAPRPNAPVLAVGAPRGLLHPAHHDPGHRGRVQRGIARRRRPLRRDGGPRRTGQGDSRVRRTHRHSMTDRRPSPPAPH